MSRGGWLGAGFISQPGVWALAWGSSKDWRIFIRDFPSGITQDDSLGRYRGRPRGGCKGCQLRQHRKLLASQESHAAECRPAETVTEAVSPMSLFASEHPPPPRYPSAMPLLHIQQTVKTQSGWRDTIALRKEHSIVQDTMNGKMFHKWWETEIMSVKIFCIPLRWPGFSFHQLYQTVPNSRKSDALFWSPRITAHG